GQRAAGRGRCAALVRRRAVLAVALALQLLQLLELTKALLLGLLLLLATLLGVTETGHLVAVRRLRLRPRLCVRIWLRDRRCVLAIRGRILVRRVAAVGGRGARRWRRRRRRFGRLVVGR